MKIKPFLMLLAVTIPAYFVFVRGVKHIPSDLRDAVSDGAYTSLAGPAAEVNVPEASAPREKPTKSKSIYGADDRQDYYAVNAALKELSDSVVSLWESKSVTVADGTAGLGVMAFGRAAGLCPGERFAEQPMGAFCSGSLVGEDLVMTAGHCIVDQAKCADTKFVFGFALKKEGDYPRSVPASDVYNCASIIQRDLHTETTFLESVFNGGPGPDFAIIKLDRKVTGRKPLAIHRKAKPANGDQLFVIGHPVGLPLKVAGSAKVRKASPKYFFMADLDTFGGNSGSAVFNANTNLIEGILVRGDVDFVVSPAGCRLASVVAQDAGKGEAVTKISAVEKYIP
ncbi:MAG: serine protease [Elusimicrobiota bacterium]|nr:serine protease [Elusimicrobiota bacterium]